jgi:hypothetical protein
VAEKHCDTETLGAPRGLSPSAELETGVQVERAVTIRNLGDLFRGTLCAGG